MRRSDDRDTSLQCDRRRSIPRPYTSIYQHPMASFTSLPPCDLATLTGKVVIIAIPVRRNENVKGKPPPYLSQTLPFQPSTNVKDGNGLKTISTSPNLRHASTLSDSPLSERVPFSLFRKFGSKLLCSIRAPGPHPSVPSQRQSYLPAPPLPSSFFQRWTTSSQ